jgi:hypothetical protein
VLLQKKLGGTKNWEKKKIKKKEKKKNKKKLTK